MGFLKKQLPNLALTFLSLLLVFGLAILVDRFLGPPPAPVFGDEPTSLLFTPGAVEHFEASEFKFTVRVNSLGLRDNPVEPGPSKRFRIVALGDSFTFGWGVELEDSWVKQLESRLRDKGYDVEVINAGKSGTGSPFYAEMSPRLLDVLRPDMLLVGMLHNDIAYGLLEKSGLQNPLWMRVATTFFPNTVGRIQSRMSEAAQAKLPLQAPPELSVEQNRASSAAAAAHQWERMNAEQRARFEGLEASIKQDFHEGRLNPFMVTVGVTASNFYAAQENLEPEPLQEIVGRLSSCLREIRQNAERFDAQCVVAIVPAGAYTNRKQLEQIKRLGFNTSDGMLSTDVPDRLTREACEEAAIPCLSVTDRFRQESDNGGLYFPLDNHFTAAGHALYAEALTPLLEAHLAEAPRIE